jgi:hypothetical protein
MIMVLHLYFNNPKGRRMKWLEQSSILDLKGNIAIRLWFNVYTHNFISMSMGEEWDS